MVANTNINVASDQKKLELADREWWLRTPGVARLLWSWIESPPREEGRTRRLHAGLAVFGASYNARDLHLTGMAYAVRACCFGPQLKRTAAHTICITPITFSLTGCDALSRSMIAFSAALSVSVTRSTPLFTWSREFSWELMAAVIILRIVRQQPAHEMFWGEVLTRLGRTTQQAAAAAVYSSQAWLLCRLGRGCHIWLYLMIAPQDREFAAAATLTTTARTFCSRKDWRAIILTRG